MPSRPVFSARRHLPARPLVDAEDSSLEQIFGELDGDIEMFFLSGIFMVLGATILIVQNLDLLLAACPALGGLFKSKLPAVRTAIAYPGAARGRTGMTIAMFSLIVFSLVMIATMNQNYTDLFLGDEANAGWDVRADAPTRTRSTTSRLRSRRTASIPALHQSGTVTTPNPTLPPGADGRHDGVEELRRSAGWTRIHHQQRR